MSKMNIATLCLIFFSTIGLCTAKRGFILTAPKVLDTGSTVHMTISLFGVSRGGNVNVKLLNKDSEGKSVIAETTVFAYNNFSTWISLSIPQMSVTKRTSAMLKVHGSFPDGYEINGIKEIGLRQRSILTLIQTDKPVYKPGQTVRFRVMPLDSQLVPLSGKQTGDIWMEDPNGIRISQWRQIDFSEGIVQLDLPLSEEPVLGEYTIKTNIFNSTESQSFDVKKYVLPKFEVTITPPPYILANAKTLTTDVCAQYSYGKKVKGFVKAKVHYENENLPRAEYEGRISGCTSFTIDTSEIRLNEIEHRKIKMFAEVLEDGTEIVQSTSVTKDVVRTPLNIEFLNGIEGSYYFKPSLSYHGKLRVSKPDGEAAVSEIIRICAKTKPSRNVLCNTFTSDIDGIVNFTIPPEEGDVSGIEIKAKATEYEDEYYQSEWRPTEIKMHQPQASITLKVWFSPSNSYLQIEPIEARIPCGKLERVKIRYTTFNNSVITFNHQVLSRGRIVQLGSHQRSFHANGETDDKVNVNAENPFLLQPYGSDDDLITIYHERSRHGTYLSRNIENVKNPSSHVAEFMLSFNARSTMAPLARLLVYYIRPDGEVVADARIFRIEQCFGNQAKLHFRHSQQYPHTEAALLLSASPWSLCGIGLVDTSVEFLKPKQKFNKQKVFEMLENFDIGKGTAPFSHIRRCYVDNIETNPDDDFRRMQFHQHQFLTPITTYADSVTAFEESGMMVITDFALETLPCVKAPPALYYETRRRIGGDRRKDSILWHPTRISTSTTDTPPTKSTFKTKKLKLRDYFPETWLWELHKIGNNGEIAFKKQLPHTITEWIGTAVCIHPKTGLGISDTTRIKSFQPFFVSLNLPYSMIRGETAPVTVSVFNYLEGCLPIKLALEPSASYKIVNGTGSHRFCVCSQTSESYKFQIRPLKLGKLDITAHAFSYIDNEICANEITAILKASDAATRQLLVEPEGFPKEETYNLYFCPKNSNGSYTTELDLLLPENMIEDSARAYVSVTGDLMGPALNGLDRLVRMPSGCGEQNMILFTPNIYVLDYLIMIGKSNKEIHNKVINNLKSGYQRELKYRHPDGSYSAFGSSDEESEGSIWLTSFVVKSFAQARRFITIDESDLSLSTAWIVRKQLENGCFEIVGQVFQKEMKGGLHDNHDSLAPLTAFVLISLLEAGYRNDQVTRNALQCLKAETNQNPYTLSLFAYASALAENPIANDYLEKLENQAIKKGDMLHWNYGNSSSINVEIAGYAILTVIKLDANQIWRALPIVRWLAKQRNQYGGFTSTQDTIVALQALSKYESYVSREPISLGIAVETDLLVHGFKIDEINKLVTQKVEISVPTAVELQAAGEGCAQAQFSLKYNVAKILDGNEAFSINVLVKRNIEQQCKSSNINICMRYKIPNDVSNMVLLEVKMVTGYVADETTLGKLINSEVDLKRYEVRENQVNLYFKQLNNEEICFHFVIEAVFDVEDVKNATVKLYDYYQPEMEITTSYGIPPCNPNISTDVSTFSDSTEISTDASTTPNVTLIDRYWNLHNGSSETDEFTTLPSETGSMDEKETETPRTTSESNFEESNITTSTLPPTITELEKSSISECILLINEEGLPVCSTELDATDTNISTQDGTSTISSTSGLVSDTLYTSNNVIESNTTTETTIFHTSNDEITSTLQVSNEIENFPSTLQPTTTEETDEALNFPDGQKANEPVYISTVQPTATEETDDLNFLDGLKANEPVYISTVQPTATEETDEDLNFPDGLEANEPVYISTVQPTTTEETDGLNFLDGLKANEPVYVSTIQPTATEETDEDLNFPDGLEANEPVYISPPDYFMPPGPTNCYQCYSEMLENFNEIYCLSSYAFVGTINEPGSAENFRDFSVGYSTPVILPYSSLNFDISCECELSKTRGTIILLKTGENLRAVSSEEIIEHILNEMSSDILIFHMPNEDDAIDLLSNSRKNCEKVA